MGDKIKKEVSFYKEAFTEAYNVFALTGVFALSAVAWDIKPLIIGLGLEALYMIFMPDSQFYKRLLNIRRGKQEKSSDEIDEGSSKENKTAFIEKINPMLYGKYKKLEKLHSEIIDRYNQTNKKTAELLKPELTKVTYLLDSYLNFLETYVRYRNYLDKVNARTIQADIDRLSKEVFDMGFKDPQNNEIKKIKQKNVDILTKRKERINKMENTLGTINAQLEIIEDTLNLINDQVVALDSPQSLGVELDDLVSGVENTENSIAETNKLLAELSRIKASN